MTATGTPELRVIDGGQSTERDTLLWDYDAEDAVVSNVLVDGLLLDDVRVFLVAEHFHSERARRVFEAACALRDSSAPIDNVTVATWLRDQGRLAQVGGTAYLIQVLSAAPAIGVSRVVAYARTVRDKWVRRQTLFEARKLLSRCESDTAGIEQIVADARAAIDEIAQRLGDTERSAHVRPVLERTTHALVAAHSSEGRGSRPSGFDRLDRVTAGLHSELVIIGARPGMGKTSLATAIAVNRANAGEGAYIASLETNDAELTTRMVCAESGVDIHRCRSGLMTPSDWSRVTEVMLAMSKLPLWIDDQSSMSVAELWAKCRRVALNLFREGKKLGVVVVDYMQLLRAPRGNMKREEVIAENARTLKAMAQELDCPVIALAQLNRECEKRNDKRPQLSDLRESGELEQCARTVLFLYREDYYRKGKGDSYVPTQLAEVHVAKQNNGPMGMMVTLRFEEQCVRFQNIAEGYEP